LQKLSPLLKLYKQISFKLKAHPFIYQGFEEARNLLIYGLHLEARSLQFNLIVDVKRESLTYNTTLISDEGDAIVI